MIIRVDRSEDEITLVSDEHSLATHSVERLPCMGVGDALLCTCGILWVTQEDDIEDYFLQRGDIFIAKREGLVVVEALTESIYRLLGRNGELSELEAR
jgi:hypothetical protein